MLEQSKAARRRFYNGNFHNRYFSGNGIDIGGRPDPFSQYIGVFPLVKNVKIWDLEDGDAQYMTNCSDGSYDFVVSSHCLEHMRDVKEALSNWIRIVKPGGYLIITIPDEDLYEQQQWPSPYNPDHKWTFTINKRESWSEKSINVLDLLKDFSELIEIEKIEKISDFYYPNIGVYDQTLHPNIESSIEFIVQVKTESIQNNQSQRELLDWKIGPSLAEGFGKVYAKIEELKMMDKKYLLYGYGSVGKIVSAFLGDKISGIVDKDSKLEYSLSLGKGPFSPLSVKTIEYDFIIITALGREKGIIDFLVNELQVESEKIITLM